MKRTPQPAPQPRRKAADADDKRLIQETLAALEQDEYGLTCEAVIEAARDPKSPLHRLFEWDLGRAAHQHWIVQAREIIVAYRVKVVTSTVTYELPYHVRNPRAPSDRQGYVTVDQLRTDVDLANEHLIAEFGRVLSALERARGYAVTLGRASEIDSLMERIVGIRRQIDDRDAA
jgi:hypothetical protein